jgi:hypothetical protein
MRLLAGILSVVFVASLSTAQTTVHAVAESAIIDEPLYEPALDTEAYFGQNLIDALETNLWGTALGSEVWNLDLDRPLDEDSVFATGTNRSGLPFEVHFASLSIVQQSDCTYGIWSGRLSAIGNFYCYGIYFAQNNLTTLIPIYSRIDQAELATLFSNIQRIWQCNLDVIGTWQMNQNLVTAHQCINDYKDLVYGLLAACQAAHWPACLGTFGIGCWTGPACLASIVVNDWIFGRNFDREISSSNVCVCNDVAFRAANPSFPPQNSMSPCSRFECPPKMLGIKF